MIATTVTIPKATNVHKTAGLIPSSGTGAGGTTVTWFITFTVKFFVESTVITYVISGFILFSSIDSSFGTSSFCLSLFCVEDSVYTSTVGNLMTSSALLSFSSFLFLTYSV